MSLKRSIGVDDTKEMKETFIHEIRVKHNKYTNHGGNVLTSISSRENQVDSRFWMNT